MTKRHFEVVAREIARVAAMPPTYRHGAIAVALNLAAAFAEENPRFDRARFLKAAGVSE